MVRASTARAAMALASGFLMATGANERLPAAAPEYRTWVTPGTLPVGLTTGPDGWLWSADSDTNTIGRIEPGTGVSEKLLTIDEPAFRLRGIAYGKGSLWVTLVRKSDDQSIIYRVALADLPDPETPFDLIGNAQLIFTGPGVDWPSRNRGMTFAEREGEEELWVVADGEIHVLDAFTTQVGSPKATHSLVFRSDPRGIAWHGDRFSVVTGGKDRRLYQLFFGGEGGLLVREYPMYFGDWRGIAVVDGDLWATDAQLATVTRYAFDLSELFSEKFIPATRLTVPGVIDYDDEGKAVFSSWKLPYLSWPPLYPGGPNPPSYPHIRRVVLSQHGAGSDVEGAFRTAIASARAWDDSHNVVVDPSNALGETLFISILAVNADEVETPEGPLDKELYPFINAEVPDDTSLFAYWRFTGGKAWGGRCWGDYGISAFQGADMLLARAVTVCPNLEEIVACGHSGGGQFTQRYAALSGFEDEVAAPAGIRMRYVPMNPGNWLYFNTERFAPIPDQNLFGVVCNPSGNGGILPPLTEEVTWIEPSEIDPELAATAYGFCEDDPDEIEDALDPESFSEYGLGIETFFREGTPMRFQYAWRTFTDDHVDPDGPVAPVVDATARAGILNRYPGRCVFYCIGDADTEPSICDNPDSNVPSSSRDRMQGCHRYQRARIFFEHVRRRFPDDLTHSLYVVPDVGHDSRGMYLHPTVRELLFADHCHATGAWMSDFAPATPPDKRHPRADLDGDGKVNEYERALNTPPHRPDPDEVRAGFEEIGGATFLTLTYTRSLVAADLALRPLVRSSLDDPRPVDAVEIRRTTLDRDTEEITVRDPEPVGGSGVPGGAGGDPARRFIHLEVAPVPGPQAHP